MKNKKLCGLKAGIVLLFIHFSAFPIYGQNLSQIYVSPVGYVIGAIFDANPGFPSDIYVSNAGQLVWVEMEVPRALIEVYSDGYVRLIEHGPSADISYDRGMIRRIGGLQFRHESGRVREIGDVHFEYESGQIRKIGDVRFDYDQNGRIRNIGNIRFAYETGRLTQIGNLRFQYDDSGRIGNINGVHFRYDYGTLKEVTGNIPGVLITITSVVEFRKKLQRE